MTKFKDLVILTMKGFQKQTFYYRIPGDENDMDIWVRGNIVLAWNSSREYFVKCDYSDLNYQHGFPWDDAQKIDINTL